MKWLSSGGGWHRCDRNRNISNYFGIPVLLFTKRHNWWFICLKVVAFVRCSGPTYPKTTVVQSCFKTDI